MSKDEIDSLVDLLVSTDDSSVKVGLNLLAYKTGYVIHKVLCAWLKRVHDNFDDMFRNMPYFVLKHGGPSKWTYIGYHEVVINYPYVTTNGLQIRLEAYYNNGKRIRSQEHMTSITIGHTSDIPITDLWDEEVANKFRNLLKLILEHDTT